MSLSLVETVRREQQQRGGSRRAQGRPGVTTLRNWLRQRACSWQPVQLPANAARLELTSPPVRALPRCRSVPPANEMAYVALEPRGAESCAGWCTGDVTGRAERALSAVPQFATHGLAVSVRADVARFCATRPRVASSTLPTTAPPPAVGARAFSTRAAASRTQNCVDPPHTRLTCGLRVTGTRACRVQTALA